LGKRYESNKPIAFIPLTLFKYRINAVFERIWGMVFLVPTINGWVILIIG
jgi:hypothetical protein